MKTTVALTAGVVIGFFAHLYIGIPAAAQSAEGQYQMFITSGASGGPYGFLLNVRTGALKFCNARAENNINVSTCLPVANSSP